MNTNLPLTEQRKEYLESLSLKAYEFQMGMRNYALSELNKIIFVLGTGTLVISISFIGYLKTIIVMPWLLIASWIFFVMAIASNISAHLITYRTSNKKMDAINQSRSSGFTTDWNTNDDEESKKLKKWGQRINWVVFISLGAGMLFLLTFCAVNLLTQNQLRRQEVVQTVQNSTSLR